MHFRFRKREGEGLRTASYYRWFFSEKKEGKKEKGKRKKLGGTKGETKGRIDSFFFFLESICLNVSRKKRISSIYTYICLSVCLPLPLSLPLPHPPSLPPSLSWGCRCMYRDIYIYLYLFVNLSIRQLVCSFGVYTCIIHMS